jgi:hypothetical protein
VRSAQAQAYLKQHGWKLHPSPRPQVQYWAGPLADDGEPILVEVPLLERARDYVDCVTDLITALAQVEDRYAVEVLNDILEETAALPTPARTGRNGKTGQQHAARKARRAS